MMDRTKPLGAKTMTMATMMVAGVRMLALGLTACSTGQPGVENQMGTIETTIEATPQQLTAAADRALREMDLTITSSQSSALDGRVVARTAQDRRVYVTIEHEAKGLSKLSIHVGAFGDETASLAILDRIRKQLGNASTEQQNMQSTKDAQQMRMDQSDNQPSDQQGNQQPDQTDQPDEADNSGGAM